MVDKIYMTENGKELLTQKIALQTERVRDIQEEKSIAYTLSGDGWHDNPGYNQLIQMEERAITELKALEAKLANAIIWQVKERNVDKVQIGSIVEYLQKSIKGGKSQNFIFEIVGHGESNLKNKQISYDSIIGQALMEQSSGYKTQISLPAGACEIEIVMLHSDWTKIKK